MPEKESRDFSRFPHNANLFVAVAEYFSYCSDEEEFIHSSNGNNWIGRATTEWMRINKWME